MAFDPFQGYTGQNATDVAKLRLAQALATEQPTGAPYRSGAIANVLSQALSKGMAGYMIGQQGEQEKARQAALSDTVGRAVDAGQGSPAGLDSRTGITWDTARPGNENMMASILAGNPQTAPMAMNMTMANMQRQKQLADELTLAKEKEGIFTAGRGNPLYLGNVAKAEADARLPSALTLENTRFGNQRTLQTDQQGFTAGQNDLNRGHQTALQTQQQTFTAGQNDLNRAQQDTLKRLEIGMSQAKTQGERENQLRDEFNTMTKDFRTVTDAYTKIKSNSPTGAGDMSLLYNYVKLLDPGSVVRESEFATAAASGSMGERIQGLAQRVISGQRLPATLRADFIKEADKIYEGQKSGADRARSEYEKLADKYGVDKSRVIVDYALPKGSVDPLGLFK